MEVHDGLAYPYLGVGFLFVRTLSFDRLKCFREIELHSFVLLLILNPALSAASSSKKKLFATVNTATTAFYSSLEKYLVN